MNSTLGTRSSHSEGLLNRGSGDVKIAKAGDTGRVQRSWLEDAALAQLLDSQMNPRLRGVGRHGVKGGSPPSWTVAGEDAEIDAADLDG